jgi:HSP20 family protein
MANGAGNRMTLVLGIILLVAVVAIGVQGYFLQQATERLESLRTGRGLPEVEPPPAAAAVEQQRAEQADRADSAPWPPVPTDMVTELRRLEAEMDRLFQSSFQRIGAGGLPLEEGYLPFQPLLDVREEAERIVVEVDLPGVVEADLDVTVRDERLLVLRGERQQTEKKGAEGKVVLHERRSGRFERQLMLPAAVDAGRMEVEREDGVLTIVLPKKKAG